MTIQADSQLTQAGRSIPAIALDGRVARTLVVTPVIDALRTVAVV
jgi:hypothetical protein